MASAPTRQARACLVRALEERHMLVVPLGSFIDVMG
jgi:hypothetical protein